MKAASALSWGHVACAFLIVGFDAFFFNCQCRNFHPEVSKIVHAQGPEKHHSYIDPLSTIFLSQSSLTSSGF